MKTFSIHGEISTESFTKFSKRLNILEAVEYEGPVHIELTSEGGAAYDALAFASRIRRSELDITITAVGLVASAAVMLLAAGKKGKRRMAREAWLMVHEDSGSFDSIEGSVEELEEKAKKFIRNVEHLRRMEEQWATLLEEFTGTSKDIWAKLHRKETYLSAGECLALGIIDEVV